MRTGQLMYGDRHWVLIPAVSIEYARSVAAADVRL